MLKIFGSSDIKKIVCDYLNKIENLRDKVVIDIPAGTGVISTHLKSLGAKVLSFDLFPESFIEADIQCIKADFNSRLPIDDEVADYVLFQEGIEHIPNQLSTLKALNRILKLDGVLLVTTPNISCLRAKASNFFVEADLVKHLPTSEIDAVWYSKDNEPYYGHLFLIGIQRLRTLAKLSGFKINKINCVKISKSSLGLFIFYPLIVLLNYKAYLKSISANKDNPDSRDAYWEMFRLNINPRILLGKHLFVEFIKEKSLAEVTIKSDKDIETIR